MGLINKTSSFFALLRLFSLCLTMTMNLPCLMASCANFLRTIYHTLSAGQAPRWGHAPRIIPMPAMALVFCLIVTDLLSGRYAATASCWSFVSAVRFGLHHLRVSVPEPCPASDSFHQLLDRVLDYVSRSLFPILPLMPVTPGV